MEVYIPKLLRVIIIKYPHVITGTSGNMHRYVIIENHCQKQHLETYTVLDTPSAERLLGKSHRGIAVMEMLCSDVYIGGGFSASKYM